MIASCYIRDNLKSLDYRYRKAKTIRDANYHSKLGVLELCGWIEISIDECVTRAGNRILRSEQARNYLSKKVKYNYGFEYERHFTFLLVSLIGIHGFEKVEREIKENVLILFRNELDALRIKRNALAHTYTTGTTPHYDAPSITLQRLVSVEAGIRSYDSALRAIYPG